MGKSTVETDSEERKREFFKGTKISRFEIRKAIKKLKKRKASGPNEIKIEAWKEEGLILMKSLYK